MKKFILAVILILCTVPMLLSATVADSGIYQKGDTGSEVFAIQRRLNELGYLNYRPTGKFSDMTSQAVRKFQQLNSLPTTGQVDFSTKLAVFTIEAVRNESNPEFKKVVGRAYTGTNFDTGVLSAWENIDKIFKVGDTVKVTDYNTEIDFKLKRIGGKNSAQVVTASQEDYNNYTEIFGGGESWEHRAVLVSINGTDYAGSIFGMPTHTEPQSESGMNGYTILYFNNSKTDLHAIADEEHVIALARVTKSN